MKLVSPLLLGVAVSLAGCAYYNGLYNANRLVDDAVRAEREGRPDEARSLWTQAAIKAESVAVRFPESKHRDDALLVQGRALTAIGRCDRAVSPLRVAADTSPDPDLRSRARLLLAACWVELGAVDSVVDILTPEIASHDPRRRSEARRLRGRAFLLTGQYGRAVDDLTGLETLHSDLDLAMAHIALGAIDEAAVLLARQIGDQFDESAWRMVLDSLSERHPELAADLVDQWATTGSLTPGQMARLFLDDGGRWLAADEADIAMERFQAARRAAADSLDGRIAAGRAAVLAVRRSGNVERVPELAEALLAAEEAGGAGAEVALFAGILSRVAPLVGTDTVRPADADLRLFLLAEAVRDSLQAPALAGALFRFLPAAYPDSPVAAKGLLAAAALDATAADSLIDYLFRTYPASPYTRALGGDARAEFIAIEDSLRMVALGAGASDAEAMQPLVRGGGDQRPKDEVIRHGRRPGIP